MPEYSPKSDILYTNSLYLLGFICQTKIQPKVAKRYGYLV